jgi:uncharacterized protein (TIGR00266 family)
MELPMPAPGRFALSSRGNRDGETGMQSRVTGTTMPVLEIGLEPGESLVAEPGEMSWMSPNMQLRTTTGAAGSRGLWGAVTRALSGGGLFMTEFTATGGRGAVAFSAKLPGVIQEITVASGQGYMVHRGGFLCGTPDVTLSIGFQRSLGAGIFGGTGFVMQQVGGSGTAWVELGGEIVSHDLAPGEQLLVQPGHVGMYEDRVAMEITTISGIANALFGGQGLFLVRLTGPGRVWLQTLTVPNLAQALAPYLPQQSGSSSAAAPATAAVVGGVAGAVLGDIFGNR